MSIITISSEVLRDGEALAERVATILGYRCVSREQLIEASQRYGIPEAKFTEILETGPNWWKRWLESTRLYRTVLQATMYEVVQGGNVVYHGHAGQEFFAGIRHVLKVLITAPVEYRMAQVQAAEGLDAIQAKRYIGQVDKARRRRLHALFGADWCDPTRYDLVVNTARISLETATHLILEIVKREDYQPTIDSEELFQDLTIKARAHAALIRYPKTKHLDIEVKVVKRDVYLSGTLHQPDSESEIIRVVQAVPGVNKVISDLKLFWFL